MNPAAAGHVDDGPVALTPIDRYLADQGRLTAVERFAQRQQTAAIPAAARYYRDLVPLERPGPGQQYGFEVDLDACTGCKACVTACHRLNGLDDGESWRTVGMVNGTGDAGPRQQTVTASCHHCVEPACLAGCPVNAYDKDPVSGIVSHLDDQCIGCRYCMLTCPYEVPRYNADRGIVRKCDLCADRLEAGEAPACVQSCPNAAIRVGLVDLTAAVRAATGALVAGAPASSITVPSTTYRSARPIAGDGQQVAAAPAPGQAHPPLAVMLVLTQLAVGASVVALVGRALAPAGLAAALRPATAVVAVAVGLLALAASVVHLGRPAYAYRAVLGWRHSWLSREIMAFAVFAVLGAAHGWVLLFRPGGGLESVLGATAALAGVAGVACSVMVYAVTRRAWWSLPRTATKFALGSLALGAATVLVTSLVSAWAAGAPTLERAQAELAPWLAATVAVVAAAKLAGEAAVLRHLGAGAPAELRRSAQLLTGPLCAVTRWRFACGAAAVFLALAVLLAAGSGTAATVSVLAGLSLAALLAGELAERGQFFTAAAPPRMPAGPG